MSKIQKNKLNKCVLFSLFASSSLLAGQTFFVTLNSNLKTTTKHSSIPDNLFQIEESVLLGLKDDVTFSDLEDYDTLEIPKKVTTIAPLAFLNLFSENISNIKTLVLNEGLISIGDSAFKGCNDLTGHLTLPSSLEKIGSESFAETNFTGQLTFPDDLVSIGDGAFRGCSNLTNFIKFNKNLASVGNYAFQDCLLINELDFTEFSSIPEWVYSSIWIFKNVGFSTKNTRTVRFENLVNTEEEWQNVLENRQKLLNFSYSPIKQTTINCFKTEVTESEKLRILGWNEDYNPADYNVLFFPEDIEEVADNAFKNVLSSDKCSLSVKFNEGLEKIGESAFEGCSGLIGSLVFPSTITEIKKKAFCYCSGFDNTIDFSKTKWLEGIPENCFESCSNFINLILPLFKVSSNIQGISDQAFYNCSSLSLIDVTAWKEDDSLPSIGTKDIFAGISQTGIIKYTYKNDDLTNNIKNLFTLCKIDFESKIEELDNSNYWIMQQNYDVPIALEKQDLIIQKQQILRGVTSEGKEKIPNISLISFPDKIKTVSADAMNSLFTHENNSLHLSFNLGLQNLEARSFYGNDYIVDLLKIPSSVETIGDSCFENCSRLRGTLVLPKITQVGDRAFSGCVLLKTKTLKLPSSLYYLGSYAFAKTTINEIIIPKDIKLIGGCALKDIENLSVIDFSSFDSIPNNNSWSSCCLETTQKQGIVKVRRGLFSREKWKNFFNSLGLPKDWIIEEVQ